MLSRLLSLWGPAGDATNEPSPYSKVQIATAVLLLEAATADDEFTLDERDHIVESLARRFGFASAEADELIEHAHGLAKESPDLWQYTNRINAECAKDEKIAIAREIWGVIYADGSLDGHEDYLVHKIGKLLNLNHPEVIDAKLAVLRERRPG